MSGEQAQAAPEAGYGTSIRVSRDVHRKLLTLQHERKMAGEFVTFSEVIEQLLEKAGAA